MAAPVTQRIDAFELTRIEHMVLSGIVARRKDLARLANELVADEAQLTELVAQRTKLAPSEIDRRWTFDMGEGSSRLVRKPDDVPTLPTVDSNPA